MRIGNIEVYGVIYKITNKVNGKVYIGQTTRENGFNGRYSAKGVGIERVYRHHKRKKIDRGNCNIYLLNSIEKHGFKNFEVCEIFDVAFSKLELNIKEELYIKLYDSTNRKYGYNFKEGGDGGKCSNDAKTKEGVKIACLNDGKIFKSKQEASEHYKITVQYIDKAMNKKFYSDYRNFEYIRFKKIKRELKPNEKFCACCGVVFRLKDITRSRRKDAKRVYNKSAKYCNKCKDKKYRETKDKNKSKDFKMKVFYTYKKQ